MNPQLLYQISVLLHVLSAFVWVGGVLFIGMLAVPTAKKFGDDELRRRLLDEMGRRFRPIGWTALGLLVVTGGYLMYHWGATFENLLDLSFFDHGHGRPLAYKLPLVAVMLAVSGLHDFWLGPRATREHRTDDEIERDRWWASILGRITGVLAILIVIFALFVTRPHM